MKNSLLLFLFLLSQVCSAQNLVPNPSFEDTVACPNFSSQINRAVNWASFRNTSDYFNSCAPNAFNGVSVPSNVVGYQFARTGDAYAGILTYVIGFPANYREWIGDSLTQPLTIGTSYSVSFFVSMAFKHSPFGIAANKIGARFTTLPYPSNNTLPLNGYSHVHTDSIINDTLNWVEVSGSFIADSAYRYIVIGNFFNDSLTSTVSSDTSFTYAYYFIDDISVMPDETGMNDSHDFKSLNIFPNPTSDILNLSLQNFRDAEVSIYDGLGTKVFSSRAINQDALTLNLGAFSPGVYLLKLVSEKDGRVVVRKVVKL